MPTELTLKLAGVWVALGFCTGLGWASAVWLIGKLLR
jgi:hypothetical protein